MNNSDNIMLRLHKIALEDDKATIHIDSGDHILLKVYKNSLKAPWQPLYTLKLAW